MKTCVCTPLHETGIIVAHIVLYAASHDTRLGRESSWLKVPSGTHFLRPLMVKGNFLRLTGGAAFLFRGKFKQPFPPAECTHLLLPLVPALGNGSHAPGRAHCQGAPVLPAPPGATSRHRSARGWPAYRQPAAAERLLRGENWSQKLRDMERREQAAMGRKLIDQLDADVQRLTDDVIDRVFKDQKLLNQLAHDAVGVARKTPPDQPLNLGPIFLRRSLNL
jgi:hypothetical protein